MYLIGRGSALRLALGATGFEPATSCSQSRVPGADKNVLLKPRSRNKTETERLAFKILLSVDQEEANSSPIGHL